MAHRSHVTKDMIVSLSIIKDIDPLLELNTSLYKAKLTMTHYNAIFGQNSINFNNIHLFCFISI